MATIAKRVSELDAAPARFLDQSEELRMELSNEQLICEAVECNHAGVKSSTLERYRDHLVHIAQYLASVHGSDFYRAKKKQVRLFMGHLEKQGGATPDPARLRCDWCKARGYPDGREGPGWSASYRKSYLSALRFLYHHFQADDELPDIDPTVLESSPKVTIRRGYTPNKEEVKRLLETDGPPRAVLLAHWLFYAPSRRKTYADARWPDIDLDAGEWEVVGKNDKVDIFPLAPPLLRAFRVYRRWQLAKAEHNPSMRNALSDPETAYVLMTRNGKKTSPSTVTKIATWHGIRAGVGLKKASPGVDAVGGMTSRVTPHCFRRAWATIALNDEKNPTPIDVVSEVLRHKDIATTRRHYAPTKSDRARSALVGMNVC
ncbi:MAG TPA: site-specific integrase [Solirubrobacterales bacterium]|nr:site-specific integrase [Solirubrobacterales bacterium]